jgi:hypothetical protein
MANSGPGWETIDRAWCWMQTDHENERLRREREDTGEPLLPPDSPASAMQSPSTR